MKGDINKYRRRGRIRSSPVCKPKIYAVIFPVVCLIMLAAAGSAWAEGISGYLDYQYSLLTSETKNIDGQASSVRTTTFNQQYNLTFLKTLYPNLKFYANGIFEKDYVKTRIDAANTTFKTTILRPVLDLSLKTPFYYAGISYTRRQERDETTGSATATSTNVREEYLALLGWKPAGLPSIDARYSRTNTFDKDRLFQNTTDDFFQVKTIYEPIKYLFVKYQGTYRDTSDLLHNVEVKQLTNNGRVNYDGIFFDNRVTLSTSYDYTRADTETITLGSGQATFQVFPFSALFKLDDTPTPLAFNPATDSRPYLIDQDRTGIGTADVDLGAAFVPSGIFTTRNMVLDFGTAIDIDVLYVWVDRFLQATTVNALTWVVYTSPDNQNWTQITTVAGAPFNLFVNRFELNIPKVTTRYLRVAVKPLQVIVPQVNADHIYVTELEAFLTKSAADIQNRITSTTGVLNFNMRARILNTPFLFYELSYFEVRSTGIQNTMRSTLSNALSAAHTFNSVFSGTARVAREDGTDQRGAVFAYAYNTSLRATPLKTLTHSLTYSGRNETNHNGRLQRDSVFLSNTVDLYKGVNLFLGGGYSMSTVETGQDQATTLLNFGSTIVPHPKVTLTLNYTSSDTALSGGGQPDSSLIAQRSDVSIAVRPFQTLYLVATLSTVHQNGLNDTLQNYSVDWSPFRGGALQIGFSYNENLRASDGSTDKIMRPNLRWNISKRSYLDIAYLDVRSRSNTQEVDSKILSANLRLSLD
jgi:hypothetical protein